MEKREAAADRIRREVDQQQGDARSRRSSEAGKES